MEGSHGQEALRCSELVWFCSLNHDCLGVTESSLKQDKEEDSENPRYRRFLKQAMCFLACLLLNSLLLMLLPEPLLPAVCSRLSVEGLP